jgi:GR25 family glycosyltransferase involved in LPS biosynthesis
MFTKIIYINLERRPDRKKNIENQLKNINNNIVVERINAIDAKKLDINNLSNKLVTKAGIDSALDKNKGVYTILTKGAIGCALSHKLAWEKVLYGDDNYVLILEDDIQFHKDYNNKLQAIINRVPDYDILYLGTHGYTQNKATKYFDIPKIIYGNFACIINKKAARILLSVFPITDQIDTDMAKVFDKLKVYTVKYDKNNNIDERIILSDLSQESYTFGTDIQHREYFSNTNNENNCNIISLLVIFGIILIFIYLKNRKNEIITN